MILFNKDTEKDIVVIAEIGVNHMGSLEWILNFLPQIKETGADAVKFQLFTPDLYVSRSNSDRHKQVSNLTISKENFLTIKMLGDSIGLPVFATPLSHDWVSFVSQKCGVIKIASGDFNFAPTVEVALHTKSKLIISTGATSRDEVKRFVAIAKKIRGKKHYYENTAILHCISSYPPPLNESNLSAILDLKKLTNLTIGFSCHFIEDAAIFAALGAGARILEIHVTDDRSRTDIRDHMLSRTPRELKNLIDNVNALNQSLSSGQKAIQPSEYSAVNQLRKGLVYSKNLSTGHLITENDLTYARPQNLKIKDTIQVVGRVLMKPVLAFTSVTPEDFGV